MIGMADRNEDDLNQFSRRATRTSWTRPSRGRCEAYTDAARPTADIVLPMLTEHTIGQLMQMLMLATVVEGRLMKINPYGQPGVEAYKNEHDAHPEVDPQPPQGRTPRRRQGHVRRVGPDKRPRWSALRRDDRPRRPS